MMHYALKGKPPYIKMNIIQHHQRITLQHYPILWLVHDLVAHAELAVLVERVVRAVKIAAVSKGPV